MSLLAEQLSDDYNMVALTGTGELPTNILALPLPRAIMVILCHVHVGNALHGGRVHGLTIPSIAAMLGTNGSAVARVIFYELEPLGLVCSSSGYPYGDNGAPGDKAVRTVSLKALFKKVARVEAGGMGSSEVESSGVESSETESGETKSSETESSDTESGEAESGEAESGEAERGGVESSETESEGSESDEAEDRKARGTTPDVDIGDTVIACQSYAGARIEPRWYLNAENGEVLRALGVFASAPPGGKGGRDFRKTTMLPHVREAILEHKTFPRTFVLINGILHSSCLFKCIKRIARLSKKTGVDYAKYFHAVAYTTPHAYHIYKDHRTHTLRSPLTAANVKKVTHVDQALCIRATQLATKYPHCAIYIVSAHKAVNKYVYAAREEFSQTKSGTVIEQIYNPNAFAMLEKFYFSHIKA